MMSEAFISALSEFASEVDAVQLQRFFKTGKGDYGEGDVFIGVRVPQTRAVCREFKDLPLVECQKLLASPIHEHRLAATIIMSQQYKKGSPKQQQALHDAYLKALELGYINNWDIIDTSCPHIVGAYAREHGSEILFSLARSGKLWHQRVAIISVFAWFRNGQAGPTLELAEILWPAKHDLLQKAVGWVLRELGKCVDEALLLDFLSQHAHAMPRTELRYAIERLSPQQREYYMNLKNT